jgi:hypothetical protein
MFKEWVWVLDGVRVVAVASTGWALSDGFKIAVG